jgi:TetR/AcrR family transcriptional regulator
VASGDSQRGPESGTGAGEERELLVAAVARAAAEHGYFRLTVDQVIRYAGVSRAAFDAHFESLEQAVVAAQDAFLGRLHEEVAAACHGDAEWPANVRAALSAGLDYLVEASTLARVFVIEAAAASLAARERQFATMDGFSELLRAGRRHYPDSADMPPMIERALIGGIASIVSDRLLSEEPRALVALEPQLAEFILVPYLGRAEARRVAED